MKTRAKKFLSVIFSAALIFLAPGYFRAAETPPWSNASPYMISILFDAQAAGLLPGFASNADLTQPITRAELASLMVLLCEQYSGAATSPLNQNPFTDADSPDILLAYCAGLFNVPGSLFMPDEFITREDMAAVFYRAVKLNVPLAEFIPAASPAIPDASFINEAALPAVKFLYENMIVIGGDGGEFMPRPITDIPVKPGYGLATREQCVVIAAKIFNLMLSHTGQIFSAESKAADIMRYAFDEPVNGAAADRDELIALLRQYANRVRWADNMAALTFTGDFRKTGGGRWRQGYDSALLYNAYSAAGGNQYKYDMELTLWGVNAGYMRHAYTVFDGGAKTLTAFEWDNRSETGTEYRANVQSFSFFSVAGLISYLPSRVTWEYKLYDDVFIDGERCVLFSATRTENLIEEDGVQRGAPPEHLIEVTDYFYVSTVTGLCVLQSNYASNGDIIYQAVQVSFFNSPSFTDAAAISPPDIEFILY
ncbi:MAG: hypothetical protein FWE82_00190 [Defluviitaleaceae bacterium]|nr:hypothetical protein [Defluviitaleaceae bacterium]